MPIQKRTKPKKKLIKKTYKKRPSPGQSATLYPVGTKKRGQDHRMYKVKKTITGVKRWVLLQLKGGSSHWEKIGSRWVRRTLAIEPRGKSRTSVKRRKSPPKKAGQVTIALATKVRNAIRTHENENYSIDYVGTMIKRYLNAGNSPSKLKGRISFGTVYNLLQYVE